MAKPVLDELWSVRAYAATDRYLVDLTSTQKTAGDRLLTIREFRYGGIGFRGPLAWEGANGTTVATSEGKDRLQGQGTRPRWVRYDAQGVSVAFLSHPGNFRGPLPARIHPDEPFFSWALPQLGDFALKPGEDLVVRYRFIVADGVLKAEDLDGLYESWISPAPSLR
jgi:hypothetical protein